MQIKDDGKGLNTTRIREKAIEKGLATEDEINSMTPKQINQFIFAPGFSTAAAVSSVSGRGVGMDVVRTNIEKIGGTIDLDSVEGEGTTVSIKIPLTLAIVSALIVESAGDRFAIPQLAVQELVMASSNGENKIEMIKGSPIYRLRDQLLPLIYLDNLLHIKKEEDDGKEMKAINDNVFIVVTKVGAYSFGIVVDRVYDTEEIVVKPVAKILNKIELFSGNTILGDGTVIMILDPGGIARSTGDINLSDTAEKTKEVKSKNAKKKTSLILFSDMDGSPRAVPLQLVSRLENIDISKIEYSNDQMVIQYRNTLMPLILFNDKMQLEKEGQQPVLVFTDGDRSMGLIVTEIIDILEDYIDVKMTSSRNDVLGSAIIREKATGIINVGHYISKAYDDWFDNHGDVDYQKNTQEMRATKTVMVVDDSPFFRNMLVPILSVAGYHVVSAETAMEAMEMLEGGEDVDIIISDIEMPTVDGFAFAKQIRNSRWSSIPMIALTSHNTASDREKGREVGFNDYVAKFDRETLLTSLADTLNQAQQLNRKGEVA
jgi:two-component system chemotaxis sensor kinase CheA